MYLISPNKFAKCKNARKETTCPCRMQLKFKYRLFECPLWLVPRRIHARIFRMQAFAYLQRLRREIPRYWAAEPCKISPTGLSRFAVSVRSPLFDFPVYRDERRLIGIPDEATPGRFVSSYVDDARLYTWWVNGIDEPGEIVSLRSRLDRNYVLWMQFLPDRYQARLVFARTGWTRRTNWRTNL